MTTLKKSMSLLLVFAMLLSMVYILPTGADAATADSYIASSYASYLSVKTTKVTNLMQYPTASSTTKYTLPADTILTVQALHKNTSGTYWYEVLFYNMTLYVDATTTTLVDHLTGDVGVANLSSPASLTYGSGFPIKGDISSKLNDLGTITASLHTNGNITNVPALSSSDEAGGKSYNLTSSAVDNKLHFNLLSPGVYAYIVTAEAISYYIDDNGSFATSAKEIILENQQCVVTDWTNPNKALAFGIDISEHNGSINWASAKNDIDYVILRLGWEETLDKYFLTNVKSVIANGIPYGVYIYSYAESAAEALGEANFVINTLKTYNLEPDLPIWFDFEDPLQVNLSYSLQATICKTFCQTIEDAGYQPGLYTFMWIMSSALTDSYFDTLPIWIAQVDGYSANGTSTYVGGLWQWQYSWKGVISGINNDVDCNYYYAEYDGISADTSYLSKCTYYPSNANATITKSANMHKYPSTDYSLLQTLSTGTGVHVTGLYKNTYGNYWYQVEVNGVTGYIGSDYASIDNLRYDDLTVVNPTMGNLSLGSGYYLKGRFHSRYNEMAKVYANIYDGENTLATPVLSSSDSVGNNVYKLSFSPVCDNLNFSSLDTGYYTYELSADVKNYYVSNGSLTSETENVVVWTTPFTVGNATIEPPAVTACDHNVVTDAAVAATCTASGLSQGSHCSKCGMIFAAQTEIPATGHSYMVTSDSATCTDYELFHYECANCGDSFDISADELTQWSETKPQGVDSSLIESKTQYRYADCTSQSWVTDSTKTILYVNSWPSGFDTSNSLYTQYNKKSSKVIASETATAKTVINSDQVVGYLYYHWCSSSDANKYSYANKSSTHTIFHAYYDTTSPDNYTCDTSDMSYKTSNSCCSNGSSLWFFVAEVYGQKYTTYKKAYDGKSWGAWSDWSDTAYTAVTNTRKVETRTVYRYTSAALGDHVWSNGVCSSCGTVCSHSGYTTQCGICGKKLVTPVITPKYPTLNFIDEVRYNIYFTTTGLDDVALEDMGMITWTTPQAAGTIDNAETVISGAVEASGMLMVNSAGISAKNLADTLYFKVYVKLSDGTYVYSPMLGYSAKAYAEDRLANSSNARLKALCVAMLNYGAAAQQHFNYKPYSLMNAGLTDAQKAMVDAYSSDMVAAVTGVSSSKVGSFSSTGGFSALAPAVSFEGAFAINYYFTPSNTMDGKLVFYYWTQEDYNKATVLTPENATGSNIMSANGFSGQHWTSYTGIAAKQLDETVFVAGVYEANGKTYCTGIIPYSLGAYCLDRINKSSDATMVELAKNTAVYGYYAKEYFANL